METEKTGYERALELIEECKKTRNTKLELIKLELKSVPKEINQCVWLKKLDLSSNQISKIENLDKISTLNSLKLSSNQISKIENLDKFPNLSSLNLSNNQISKIENLDKISTLNSLKLSSNQISKIENLDRISNLNSLDLSYNEISKIENLNNLCNLESIDLIQNKLKRIENLDKVPNLNSLKLSNNQISKIENLDKTPNLNSLDLSYNEISKIENLNNLYNLESIDLIENKLKKIENLENLENLNKLNHLNLAVNQISKIENLENLKNLEFINFYKNQIVKIENLNKLKEIKFLSFDDNQISKIENLSSLLNLTSLWFSNNKISKIENLNGLNALKKINFRENNIEDLKPLVNWLKKNLSVIHFDVHSSLNSDKSVLGLKDCPLKNPPIEIVKQGTEAVLRYFEDIETQGIDHLYEAKTLIIGKAGAGKTSFRYKLKDQKCKLPEDNESTKGIDIDPMTFPIPKKDRNFNVNIWDFGGQEIYHNTHQFFLTKRSLYILVADYRTEKHEINYWIQIVEMMGSGSPLLIVQNEKDNRVGDLNLPGLKSQYSEIYKDDFRVDLRAVCEGEHHKIESEKAFKKLQTEIQSKLLQLPHIGDVLPKQWVVIRKEIEKLAAQKAYISEDEFYDLCAAHQITDNQKQRDLSQYFHDLGVFLHFQNEDKPSALSEIVILQNTWATEAVYKVLDSTLVKDEQFGRFTYRDLKQIWQDSTWRSKAKELLELMMEFQLCYQISDTSEYIAPQLLPAQQPDYTWGKTSNLQLRYRYGFMPKGIITRFIVKMHKYIAEGQTLVWKEGVILEYQDTKAEVIETYRDNEIHIRVSGSRGKELLTIIAHNIDELNGAFEKIRVDKLVPCNCDECKGLSVPNFYEYSDLDRRRKKGKRTIECKISYDDVDVLKLIDDVFIDRYGDKEEVKRLIAKPDLKRAIRLLENMIESDSPEANELLVIQSNFMDSSNKYHQKILNDTDYQQVRAKTAAALLSILNEL